MSYPKLFVPHYMGTVQWLIQELTSIADEYKLPEDDDSAINQMVYRYMLGTVRDQLDYAIATEDIDEVNQTCECIKDLASRLKGLKPVG